MRRIATTAFLFATALAAPAQAAVPHTVTQGETLWSIAAASNLTTRTVAAFNGLSENANIVLGSTVMVPSVAEGAAALQSAGLTATPGTVQSATPSAAPAPAPAPMGGYTVRPGDTLSGLAASARVPVAAIAQMNGLDQDGLLLAGTVIKLPTGASQPAAAVAPAPDATVVPQASPNPTPNRVTASDISSVASQHGVSPSLASAIAWQESGFNNAMVSAANARGVMQVMPGTWQEVEDTMASSRLDPNSAHDNIKAGVLYLKHLLQETGGDESAAIAAYYQGLGAVRSRGLFDDTRRYVDNVQALRSRFGG